MEIATETVSALLKLNRRPPKLKGERIESATGFFLRYYITTPTGERKQKSVRLAKIVGVVPLMGRCRAAHRAGTQKGERVF